MQFNVLMCQEKRVMRFSESILTLYKNTALLMFLYAALYLVNPAVMFRTEF